MLTDPVHEDEVGLKVEKELLAWSESDKGFYPIEISSRDPRVTIDHRQSARTIINSDKGTRYAY